MENNNTTFLNLKFDNTKLLASAKEAEKLANDTVKNISNSFNKAFSGLNFGKIAKDIDKIDLSKVKKLADSFSGKLNTSLKDLNLNIKLINSSLTKMDKLLSNIKINSNIKVNIAGGGKFSNSVSQKRKNSDNNNQQDLYSPNWEYPSYFRTNVVGKNNRLPDYSNWEYNGGKTDWAFGDGGFQGTHGNIRRPDLQTIHALEWNGAYDAEWREQTPREKEARHAPDNSGHNINDQNITPEGDLSGFSLFNIKDFFGTEEKQRKKRTKAEDRFINGMTKVAGVLTGIYGVNSITNRVGNVIQEGAKLGLLSSYTGEDPKRLFLYNEAIKRTTHQDSYGQFETLRTRVMDSILQGDTNMANLLGISTEDAWKYNTPTKILDAVRTSKNLKTPELKQAFLRKMGIDDMTAMALTNESQFGKDYKHVESIGAFSKENVDQMKDLVNVWEDLNQQSKVFMLNFIDPMTHFLHDMLEMSTRLNDLLAGHPNKHVSIQEQADAAYLNDSDGWTPFSLNHAFDSKEDVKQWKANWIKQHSPHLAASANGQNNVSASGIDINQIGYDMDGVESNHNPNAVNESATSSAIGAGQITPTTAAGYFGIHLKPKEHLTHEQREMVKQKLYDPKVNKNVQLWLIQKNLEQLQAEGGLQDSYLAGAKNRSLYWLGTTDLNKITPSQRKAVLDYGKKHPLHFKFDHHFHDAPADFDKKKHQGLMEDSFKSIFQKSLADAALAFASPTL